MMVTNAAGGESIVVLCLLMEKGHTEPIKRVVVARRMRRRKLVVVNFMIGSLDRMCLRLRCFLTSL